MTELTQEHFELCHDLSLHTLANNINAIVINNTDSIIFSPVFLKLRQ